MGMDTGRLPGFYVMNSISRFIGAPLEILSEIGRVIGIVMNRSCLPEVINLHGISHFHDGQDSVMLVDSAGNMLLPEQPLFISDIFCPWFNNPIWNWHAVWPKEV